MKILTFSILMGILITISTLYYGYFLGNFEQGLFNGIALALFLTAAKVVLYAVGGMGCG